MTGRFRFTHLVLVSAIVGVFALRYVTQLDLPSWLYVGLSAVVVGGAAGTYLGEYRQTNARPLVGEAPTVRDPQFVRFLFSDVRSAPLWLVVRLYLGLQWLDAGWHKVTDDAWMRGGTALRAFWERVVAVPEPPGRAAITYDWYRDFIQFMLDQGWYVWFARVVSISEVLIGIALIVGAFVGFAAAAGLMMNTAFMLAGTASTNPVLGGCAILIVLGWKVAGHWGLDRYLLPTLGAPWARLHPTARSSNAQERAASAH